MTTTTQDPTVAAYEAFAPFYDSYTAGQNHDRWLTTLEEIAVGHGLYGNRLLDIACGTGRSFMPMLARGWEVTACDISPSMVARARDAAAGTSANVFLADVRELPVFGRFDLVTSINDSLNYLLTPDELLAGFRGAARNLRPGGMFVFDLATLHTYRHYYTRDTAAEIDGNFFCLRGQTDPHAEAGMLATSVLEVFATDDGESWHRTRCHHVQRHYPAEVVERLLEEAGFQVVERRGNASVTRIEVGADENRHVKIAYFARRATTDRADPVSEGR